MKVSFEIFIKHFNLPHLNNYICSSELSEPANLTGYPFTYVFFCRKLPS